MTKKTVHKTIMIIFTILILWMALFITDFFRLKDSFSIEKKPLITYHSQIKDNRQIYNSLGYSVEYYLNPDYQSVYGFEFKLFGNIIWAWVE